MAGKKKTSVEKPSRDSIVKSSDSFVGKTVRKEVKIKAFKFYILNVKITSRNPVTDQIYRNLFEKSFTGKKTAHLAADTDGIIRQLFNGKGTESQYGVFCRYIKPEGQAMNIDSLEIIDFEIPRNLFLNPKEASFVFYPDLHRIAIPSSSKLSLNTVKKMAEGIFRQTIGKSDSVEVLVEQSSDAFAKIIAAKEIKNVHIEITPSNADINKDATDFMDREIKMMGAGSLATDIRPGATGRLNVENSKVLQGFFGMAASNGHVKATIINDDDKKEVINTEKHPAVFSVAAGSAEESRNPLYNVLKRRFRNG
jgi:hypothetical protein